MDAIKQRETQTYNFRLNIEIFEQLLDGLTENVNRRSGSLAG